MVCMEHDIEGERECNNESCIPEKKLKESTHNSKQHRHIRTKQ